MKVALNTIKPKKNKTKNQKKKTPKKTPKPKSYGFQRTDSIFLVDYEHSLNCTVNVNLCCHPFLLVFDLFGGYKSVQNFKCLFISVFTIVQLSKGRVGILLTIFTQPNICACLKPRPGFPTPYVKLFFVVRS